MEEKSGNVIDFAASTTRTLSNGDKAQLAQNCRIIVGNSVSRRGERPVTLSDSGRSQHTMIVGASGTGKSTLMMNIIDQIIKYKQNESLFVLDPHGEMYQQACKRYIKKATENFISIDLSSPHHGFQHNPLAFDADEAWYMKSRIVNDFLELFDHIYDMDRAGGPIFELYMRQALLLLLNDREVHTLGDVAKLFNNSKFHRELVSRCNRKDVVEFWSNATKVTGDCSLEGMSVYISSKLTRFVTNPLVGRIFNSTGANFDFGVLFEKPTIVFLNLSKGILSNTDISILGTMLLQRVNLMALKSQQRRGNVVRCNVLLDEAHNFLTPTMVQMFPEARKFGINMMMAIQNLGQLEDSVGTLLGNVANLVSFRVGLGDAEHLGEYFKSVGGDTELLELPNFTALARLLSDNGVNTPQRVSIRPT